MKTTIFSKSNLFKTILVGIIWLLMVFVVRECKRIEKKYPIGGGDTTIVTVSDTSYLPGDTVYRKVEVPVPTPYIVNKPVPVNVDTAAILRDYYNMKVYQSYIEDTMIRASLKDSVSQNKIIGRKFEYILKRGPMVITNTVTKTITEPAKQKLKLFVGLELNGNVEEQSASANIGLLTKRDHGYLVGYNPFDKKISAGVLWKIKLHK